MTGSDQSKGIMELAFTQLLSQAASSESVEVSIWVSYLEIYNEIVNDLLEPSSVNLKVVEDNTTNLGS